MQAQMILSCVYRCEERYRITMICDVLRGSQNQRVLHAGLNDLSTYGLLSDTPYKKIRQMIDALLTDGFLRMEEGEYPVLRLTAASAEILRGQRRVETEFVREAVELPKRPNGWPGGGGQGFAGKTEKAEASTCPDFQRAGIRDFYRCFIAGYVQVSAADERCTA